jgi:hypothetical protein
MLTCSSQTKGFFTNPGAQVLCRRPVGIRRLQYNRRAYGYYFTMYLILAAIHSFVLCIFIHTHMRCIRTKEYCICDLKVRTCRLCLYTYRTCRQYLYTYRNGWPAAKACDMYTVTIKTKLNYGEQRTKASFLGDTHTYVRMHIIYIYIYTHTHT